MESLDILESPEDMWTGKTFRESLDVMESPDGTRTGSALRVTGHTGVYLMTSEL